MLNAVRVSLTVCLFLAIVTSVSCGDQPDVYNVSIPNLKAEPDESISSINVRVEAGTIQAVSNIPVGWQVSIEDDISWESRLKAYSTSGAASMSPDELKRLVFSVRHNNSIGKFNLSGVVLLSKTFQNRKLALMMPDFALKSGDQ